MYDKTLFIGVGLRLEKAFIPVVNTTLKQG